jgi:SAM-dependent methyltransferase
MESLSIIDGIEAGKHYWVPDIIQTLEHVPDPKKFIDECRRILRPGGIMFCTVPFIFEYHAVPRDFYRWTHEGLTQDLENGGFNILQIQAIESDWESILTVLQLFLSRQYGYFFTKPLFLFLNLLSFLPTNKNNNVFPLTYAATAVKQ